MLYYIWMYLCPIDNAEVTDNARMAALLWLWNMSLREVFLWSLLSYYCCFCSELCGYEINSYWESEITEMSEYLKKFCNVMKWRIKRNMSFFSLPLTFWKWTVYALHILWAFLAPFSVIEKFDFPWYRKLFVYAALKKVQFVVWFLPTGLPADDAFSSEI
jgi:hypothetical protein